MKTSFFSLILATIGTSPGFAQGTVNFANFGPGVNAPVTDSNGVRLNGPSMVADLYYVPGIVFDSTVLIPLGQPAHFRTNGYFIGGPRTIPGQLGGGTITAQVRVWDSAYASTWMQAQVIPGAFTAESLLFTVVLTSLPDPPASLTGLQPFSQTICLSCSQPWYVAVSIHSSGPGGLVLSWPDYFNTFRYRVQQNPDLNPAHWIMLPDLPTLVALPPFGYPVFQVVLTNPPPKMFYRLVWQ